jgi:dolichol-phosphate mannosyltransferase
VAAAARAGDAAADITAETARRRWWFVVVFTLVPLAGFALPSFWSETKLHWTGPIWLAGLPAMAASLARAAGGSASAGGGKPGLLDRTWVAAVHALMLGYALGLFYYPVYGLAGIHAHHSYVRTGWRDLREQVQAIEEEVLRETGRRPAIVGLDKHNTADEMAYYDPRGDGALDTASRHLFFDETALMYEFWFPRRAFEGRDLIVVSRSPTDVEDARVGSGATRLGPVRTLEVRKHGAPAGRFYARVVYGYRVPAMALPSPTVPGPSR